LKRRAYAACAVDRDVITPNSATPLQVAITFKSVRLPAGRAAPPMQVDAFARSSLVEKGNRSTDSAKAMRRRSRSCADPGKRALPSRQSHRCATRGKRPRVAMMSLYLGGAALIVPVDGHDRIGDAAAERRQSITMEEVPITPRLRTARPG
jgi:hypothetical protein